MAMYEYKVLEAPQINDNVNVAAFEEQLNELGRRRWKVVGTGGAGAGNDFGFSQSGWAILMREV